MTIQTMPKTIDENIGAIYYSWEGNKGKPEDAFLAEFYYWPGRVEGDDIISAVEVSGSVSNDSGIAEDLPVFESLVETIHISGPAI